jgi:hypothetical protein
MKKSVIFVILAVAVLGGSYFFVVPTVKKSYDKNFKQAFTQAFRGKFLAACQAGDPSPKRKVLCECIAGQAMAQLTVKQLRDQEFAKEYVRMNIMPACVERLSSQEPAGG